MFQKRLLSRLIISLIIPFIIILNSCVSNSKKFSQEKKVFSILQTARSYSGTPYKWGGTTRAGMDCSGLVVRSFESVGIDLPRTTNVLRKTGVKVKPNKLKPGDLVFFAAGNGRKITHVGIVTEVRSNDDVRFIHASSKLGVIEVNLMAPYYQRIFKQARRMDLD